jgi:hypothetical protein
MLLQIQNYSAPTVSAIDVNTIQANFKLATPSQYELSKGGTLLRKIGGASNESRSCEMLSKPRPGKFFMRFKPNGPNYSTILISNGLVNANNQLAWTSGSLAGNVWHEIRIEHVSGETYKFTVNGTVLYQGTAKNLSFYGHTYVTEMEFDLGQLGTVLPAGFEWY